MKFCRTICFILCLALMLGLLSACGGQPSVAESAYPVQMPTALPDADLTSSPAPISSPEPTKTVEPTPSPDPTPEPTPEPERETVAPSSVLLPDIEAFLYYSASTNKQYGSDGWQLQWNGCLPYAAYETVQQELLDLLAEERYQLKLRECVLNPHYGITVCDYYYDYPGTSGVITKQIDKHEEYEFDVALSFSLYPDDGYFKLTFKFSNGFTREDPGSRTTRDLLDTRKGGNGGVIATPPTPSSGGSSSGVPDSGDTFVPEASRLDCLTCLTCRGDGDCNTCGGDGYTGFGSAKAGCRTCHGNGKCRACGGSGKR